MTFANRHLEVLKTLQGQTVKNLGASSRPPSVSSSQLVIPYLTNH